MGVFLDGIRWRAADLIAKAENAPIFDETARALREALLEIAGERNAINPRILGRWIERHTDTRCNGLYASRAGEKARALQWQIKKCE
jgi:hypothetical protein